MEGQDLLDPKVNELIPDDSPPDPNAFDPSLVLVPGMPEADPLDPGALSKALEETDKPGTKLLIGRIKLVDWPEKPEDPDYQKTRIGLKGLLVYKGEKGIADLSELSREERAAIKRYLESETKPDNELIPDD